MPDFRERLKRNCVYGAGKGKHELLLLIEKVDGVYEDVEEDDKEQSERMRKRQMATT